MDGKTLYLRLLRNVRPYRKAFAFAILATVVLALTEPGIPYLLKFLLDGSFVQKDERMILLIPMALVGLFLVRAISTVASSVALEWVSNRVVTDLRIQAFAHLLTMPVSYFDEQPTGVTLSKISYDVEQVTQTAARVLIVLVRDSLSVLGLLALIIYLNWRLALFTLLVLPFIALVVKVISKRLRALNRDLQERMGELTHTLEEGLGGNRVVRLFGGQEYEVSRFAKVANRVRQLKVKVTMAANASSEIVHLLTVLAVAFMAYFAAKQSAAGQLTVGEFTAFFGGMAMLLAPIKRLTNINDPLQKGLAAAESIFSVLDAKPERSGSARLPPQVQGNLSFRSVGFRFPGSEQHALQGIDLEIRRGEHIALVGPSGSGKTTLANLVPLFYQPQSGQILLDGADISSLDLVDLRHQIALVSQDVVLFDDTVRANIAYGELAGASVEAVREAAKAANALEFIEAMPNGLETEIGANGVRLSGGQRQRLAIARAMLKNAPILILDEATSALDNQSERAIQEAVERLKAGRTTITIAHRLSTIENADRILVLEQGRLAESGTHAELLEKGGLYARLYQARIAQGEDN